MDRSVLVSNPTEPVAEYAAIPDCNLYNREGLPASPSGFLMTTAKVSTNNCGFPLFGTRSVQLSATKSGRLLPKRHQIKHLGFVVSWFGTRGSEVQILSPRPNFLNRWLPLATACLRLIPILIFTLCPKLCPLSRSSASRTASSLG